MTVNVARMWRGHVMTLIGHGSVGYVEVAYPSGRRHELPRALWLALPLVGSH